MSCDPNAEIEISAFSWVPPFAEGLVRDLRARWVLEEAGLSYKCRLMDSRVDRPESYFLEQTFGQVPIYREGPLQLFETGAMVRHGGGEGRAAAAEGSGGTRPCGPMDLRRIEQRRAGDPES